MVAELNISYIIRQLRRHNIGFTHELATKAIEGTDVKMITALLGVKKCQLIFVNGLLTVIDYDGRSYDGRYTDESLLQVFEGILGSA